MRELLAVSALSLRQAAVALRQQQFVPSSHIGERGGRPGMGEASHHVKLICLVSNILQALYITCAGWQRVAEEHSLTVWKS